MERGRTEQRNKRKVSEQKWYKTKWKTERFNGMFTGKPYLAKFGKSQIQPSVLEGKNLNVSVVRCTWDVGNNQMKRYISAKARENSKHVKPKLPWMDFFDNKCFQYGVNHCKTTFISCLCLSKGGMRYKAVQTCLQRAGWCTEREMRSSQTGEKRPSLNSSHWHF